MSKMPTKVYIESNSASLISASTSDWRYPADCFILSLTRFASNIWQ